MKKSEMKKAEMKTGTKYRVECDRDEYGTYTYCVCDDLEDARVVASHLRSLKSSYVKRARVVKVKTVRRVIRCGGAYAELYPITDKSTGEDVWGWRCTDSPYTYTGSATTFDEAREAARRMLKKLRKTE